MHAFAFILESPDRRHWDVRSAINISEKLEVLSYTDDPSFPCRLVAAYRIEIPREYEEMGTQYPDVIACESVLAEKMMRRVGREWYNVKSRLGVFKEGDPYPRQLLKKSFPILCFCGYPAETRKSTNGSNYYSCPRKNRQWMLEEPFPEFIRLEATKCCGFFSWAQFY